MFIDLDCWSLLERLQPCLWVFAWSVQTRNEVLRPSCTVYLRALPALQPKWWQDTARFEWFWLRKTGAENTLCVLLSHYVVRKATHSSFVWTSLLNNAASCKRLGSSACDSEGVLRNQALGLSFTSRWWGWSLAMLGKSNKNSLASRLQIAPSRITNHGTIHSSERIFVITCHFDRVAFLIRSLGMPLDWGMKMHEQA